MEYHHKRGELSTVIVEESGMGVRKFRIANFPPETLEPTLRDAMSKFGDIKSTWEELWPKVYRCKFSNGVRIVTVGLKKHIPSNLSIAGHSVMVSYEGQPSNFYGCNESGYHLRECPRRKTTVNSSAIRNSVTWANGAGWRAHASQDRH